MPIARRRLAALALPLLAMPAGARAATKREIDDTVGPALARLRDQEGTRILADNAKAILVFPRIIRGGFVFGGQYGNGAMIEGTETTGYYNIAGASFGLQIGAQSYGLAMFIIAVASDFNGYLVGMAIGGLGFGMYAAVDLALVADVLPDRDDVAKDLGVFNIAGALPFSIAPAVAPAILAMSSGSYGVLYLAAGACAILGAVAILPVKRVR